MHAFFDAQESNPVQDVAELLVSLAHDNDMGVPWVESIVKLQEEGQNEAVLSQLTARASLLFTAPNSSSDDAEGALNVLTYLVSTVEPAKRGDHVREFTKLLTGEFSDGTVPLRLRALAALANHLEPTSALRFDAVLGLVKLAAASGRVDTIVPQLEHVERWLQAWGASVYQARTLYRAVADALRGGGHAKRAFDFMLLHLQTFNDSTDASVYDTIREQTVTCIVHALNTPDLLLVDELLHLGSVQHLSGDRLFALLQIFVSGTLADYQAFAKADAALLADAALGLDAAALVLKIKYLTLVSLAARKKELPYAEICADVEVARPDLETFLIEAIRAGLVEGRLDQMGERLLVSRTIQRQFTTDHWKGLLAQLRTLNGDLDAYLGVVNQAHAHAQQFQQQHQQQVAAARR